MTAPTETTYPELAWHPRPLAGVTYPHPNLENSYEPGTTEPWIAQIVSSLLIASGGRTILETGGFRGTTSAWLALTLEKMGGGSLTVAEIDAARAQEISDRFAALSLERTQAGVAPGDVMNVIHLSPDKHYDLVWLDDDHTEFHVRSEITALWPKVKPGGLILVHDVFGSTDLRKVVNYYGGYSLDLPRLGPAGGLGILQIPK